MGLVSSSSEEEGADGLRLSPVEVEGPCEGDEAAALRKLPMLFLLFVIRMPFTERALLFSAADTEGL